MSDELGFEAIEIIFTQSGINAGMAAVLAQLESDGQYHTLFRALLLKRRAELGLPLIQPGELRTFPAYIRETYQKYVDEVCRKTGESYLKEGKIPEAWRYFQTLNEREPIYKALEELDADDCTDAILAIAIDEGIHPVQGFKLLLAQHGLSRAIVTYERGFPATRFELPQIAGLLVRNLYRDLVLAVRRNIQDLKKDPPTPDETDLVDLVAQRPWLFENGNCHANPQHVAMIARIGLIVENRDELLMALSIAEYAKKLSPVHAHGGTPPFENGYPEYTRYYRALLGQNAEKTAEFFCTKLAGYDLSKVGLRPVEISTLLLWRQGRKDDALGIWELYATPFIPPDQPCGTVGAIATVLPTFYEMCQEAGDFKRLARIARTRNDVAVWTAAKLQECGGGLSGNANGSGEGQSLPPPLVMPTTT